MAFDKLRVRVREIKVLWSFVIYVHTVAYKGIVTLGYWAW